MKKKDVEALFGATREPDKALVRLAERLLAVAQRHLEQAADGEDVGEPDQIDKVAVTFAPKVPGAVHANLLLRSNDADTPEVSSPLCATAVPD